MQQFFPNRVNKSFSALDKALALAGFPAGNTAKWQYWFSFFFFFFFEGVRRGTKTSELLEMGTTPYLTITKISSFNLC